MMAMSKEEKHWNEIELKMFEVWRNGQIPIINRQVNFLGDLCRWIINNKPDKKQMYKELRRIEKEEQKAFTKLRKQLNKAAKNMPQSDLWKLVDSRYLHGKFELRTMEETISRVQGGFTKKPDYYKMEFKIGNDEDVSGINFERMYFAQGIGSDYEILDHIQLILEMWSTGTSRWYVQWAYSKEENAEKVIKKSKRIKLIEF